MDREPEELQFFGLCGIYREAYNITLSCRKIFSQIILALILPLSFIFLAHTHISRILFSKILQGKQALDHTRLTSPTYNKIHSQISSELTTFWLFKTAYFLFVLVLSLLSTSAIVYTIACAYTAKQVTFKRVLSVVPKVWKRLIITFLWNFLVMLGYNLVAFAIVIATAVCLGHQAFVFVFVFILILYLIGFVCINVVWQLASVVSVLEDKYGLEAMMKSKALIKGKMVVASAIYLTFLLAFVAIQIGFQKLVDHSGGIANRVSFGMVCLLLLSMLNHYALVLQTVIYFVCKSYHHENIDKSCLSGHLEGYQGEYVPLIKSKDLQLEQFYA